MAVKYTMACQSWLVFVILTFQGTETNILHQHSLGFYQVLYYNKYSVEIVYFLWIKQTSSLLFGTELIQFYFFKLFASAADSQTLQTVFAKRD